MTYYGKLYIVLLRSYVPVGATEVEGRPSIFGKRFGKYVQVLALQACIVRVAPVIIVRFQILQLQ